MGTNPNLSVGDDAPDFSAPTDAGDTLALSDLAGSPFVLYFYPKDDTPGCTTQACDFRDNKAAFEDLGRPVYGVSPDSVASHEAFRDKYDLNFPLIADPDHAIAEAYGVWREKKNYGRTYMGIVRSTFLVDAEGKIEAIFDNVRAKGHVARLLRDM